MQHIRVSTFAGPGAKPVIHSVPWPKIPKKAALIQIGACGPGRSRWVTNLAASSSKPAASLQKTS
jgi:hypothetical protein